MCVNYLAVVDDRRYEAAFGVKPPSEQLPGELLPKYRGSIVRRAAEAHGFERESLSGTWGLLPWFAKTPKIDYNTVNARSDRVAAAPSYKGPWARGQRCIVPMQAFFEPNWESGVHVRWRFERRDGEPLGVAGFWERWHAGQADQILSYTLLTVNADQHPLFRRMHRPEKEKRMLAVLDPDDYDAWLECPVATAATMLVPYPADRFVDRADPKPKTEKRAPARQENRAPESGTLF
ncbi:MAG: SOS response-associated peptidase [Methylibium sp.]|uniref:SOS response-associated peptidase n=1 Tax=Methylibium sp. TaxID=2067992 RepID=UPI0017B36D6C|nr:SOS response-associated peptidase family protein [Methylibium sp.]MBA3597732.1 SOS response-associated peptidase [Methylibium sp.]